MRKLRTQAKLGVKLLVYALTLCLLLSALPVYAAPATVTFTATDAPAAEKSAVRADEGDILFGPDKVSFGYSSLPLQTGAKYTLGVTFSPTDSYKSLTWSSSDRTVATVSSKGVVTGVKPGKATITAKATLGGKSAKCVFTVQKGAVKAKSATISPTNINIAVGQKTTITTKLSPPTATSPGITYSSSNTAVASVTSKGVVTAKNNGKATVTVNMGKVTRKVSVNVSSVNGGSVRTISFQNAPKTMMRGNSVELKFNFTPVSPTNTGIRLKTSNSDVIDLSKTNPGVIRALHSGTATITATSVNNPNAACSVTITVSGVTPTKIELTPPSVVFNGGSVKQQMTAKVYPEGTADDLLVWQSSSDATVFVIGQTTADKVETTLYANYKATIISGSTPGKATVSAYCKSRPGIKASCDITVNSVSVSSVAVSNKTITINKGDSASLSAAVYPANASNQLISWAIPSTYLRTSASGARLDFTAIGCTPSEGITITVKSKADETITDTCKLIIVGTEPTGVSFQDIATDTIKASGEAFTKTGLSSFVIDALINPGVSNGNAKADERIRWSSSNENIAKVAGSYTAPRDAVSRIPRATISPASRGEVTITAVSEKTGKVLGTFRVVIN